MQKIEKPNFLTTLDNLFEKHLGKPILILLALIPFLVFAIVEIQSRENLKSNIKDQENELTQAIVSGDSYMATRIISSLGKSLQLNSVRLYAKDYAFAEFGKSAPEYMSFLYWNLELHIVSSWGEPIGTIKVQSKLLPIQRVISATFILFSFLWLFYLLAMSKNYKKNIFPIISEIQNLTLQLNTLEEHNTLNISKNKLFITDTAADLSKALDRFINMQSTLILKNVELEKHQATASLAKQVAHDIRSPLSALNMISSAFKDIPEEKRLLIRNAIQRINDIANDLLSKSKQSISNEVKFNASEKVFDNKTTFENLDTILLPALVDSLISEKRIQYRDYINVQIEVDLENSFGAFIRANAKDLMRVLSNLINNAIESFSDNKGEVVVSVRAHNEEVQLTVKDNGKGIPPEILKKLGHAIVTYGKENTESGSGIGVYHARKTIEAFGGKLDISSKIGHGSLFEITFPRFLSPAWFLNEIKLHDNSEIICLDDDLTIHQIWKGRLQSLKGNKRLIKITNFTSPIDFNIYVQKLTSVEKSNITFLIDYELLGHDVNGLDIIEKLNLKQNTVLVTSRYEESNIKRRCESLNIKLLPKALAGFVPITIEATKIIYDCVLIDDDELVHMTWKMAAEISNIQFIGFKSYADFKSAQASVDFKSTLFIDSNLGDGVKGEAISKQIAADGFQSIYLCTGYEASSFPAMPWIKGIVSKDPYFN